MKVLILSIPKFRILDYNLIMDFISWLRHELNERQISISELARISHISQPSISRVLSGKQAITNKFCVAIAHALDKPDYEVLMMAGLSSGIPEGIQDEWVYDLVKIASTLTPNQRQHAMNIMKMIHDGTIKI